MKISIDGWNMHLMCNSTHTVHTVHTQTVHCFAVNTKAKETIVIYYNNVCTTGKGLVLHSDVLIIKIGSKWIKLRFDFFCNSTDYVLFTKSTHPNQPS